MCWRRALLALGTNTFGTGNECILHPITCWQFYLIKVQTLHLLGITGNQIPESRHPGECGKPWGFAADCTWFISETLTRVHLCTENSERET